jgi:hypothetical protein
LGCSGRLPTNQGHPSSDVTQKFPVRGWRQHGDPTAETSARALNTVANTMTYWYCPPAVGAIDDSSESTVYIDREPNQMMT